MMDCTSLDEEIAAVREKLEASREGRRVQRQAYHAEMKSFYFKLKRLRDDFWARIEKGNDLGLYQRVMKEKYDHVRDLPGPTTLRKQVLLIFVSHQIELFERSIAFVSNFREEMRLYMLCEMAVLDDEVFELKKDFMVLKKEQLQEQHRVEAPFKRRLKVQHMAMARIQSLIKMKEEIRSHSFILNSRPSGGSGASTSSFEKHDLMKSLSLVSSNFKDSFKKLEAHASPTTERENLAIQLTQLLEIDGTFPGILPEDDEFFQHSMTEMIAIESQWR